MVPHKEILPPGRLGPESLDQGGGWARGPGPGQRTGDSWPRPMGLAQEARARSPEPGDLSQETLARDPEPGGKPETDICDMEDMGWQRDEKKLVFLFHRGNKVVYNTSTAALG